VHSLMVCFFFLVFLPIEKVTLNVDDSGTTERLFLDVETEFFGEDAKEREGRCWHPIVRI